MGGKNCGVVKLPPTQPSQYVPLRHSPAAQDKCIFYFRNKLWCFCTPL